MTLLILISFQLLSILVYTADGWLPILDKTMVKAKGTFTAVCDAGRFDDFPESVDLIEGLHLSRTPTGMNRVERIASFFPFEASSDKSVDNIPRGRLWSVARRFGYSNASTNKDTMSIVLIVHDANLADAGYYQCLLEFTEGGDSRQLLRFENIEVREDIQASESFGQCAVIPDSRCLVANVLVIAAAWVLSGGAW